MNSSHSRSSFGAPIKKDSQLDSFDQGSFGASKRIEPDKNVPVAPAADFPPPTGGAFGNIFNKLTFGIWG